MIIENVNSGSEVLEVESQWRTTSGEAENECKELINELINSAEEYLESQGKRVTSREHGSMSIEERQNNEEKEFKAETTTTINWIEDSISESGDQFEIYSELSDTNYYLIVEDELLKRFRNKFRGRYSRIGLGKVDFIDSNIEIDESDFIEMPKKIEVNSLTINNCSPNEDVIEREIVITEYKKQYIELTKKLTTKTNAGFNIGIKTPEGLSIGGDLSKDWTMETSRVASEEKFLKTTQNKRYKDIAPKFTKLIINHISGVNSRKYKLRGTALFDGVVHLSYKTRKCNKVKLIFKISWDCHDVWHPYTVKLSDILTLEERLIDVDGYLVSIDSKYETKNIYTEPANDCFKTPAKDDKGILRAKLSPKIKDILSPDSGGDLDAPIIIYPPYTSSGLKQ